ncbi:MAG: VWA domain-containing protein [Chloroflexi bacterium]|nr:VWA domain-containing protein [Chloroflexota bacterium]
MEGNSWEHYREELKQFPSVVYSEFERTLPIVQALLAGEDMEAWLHEGISVANHSLRSWEAATEYFRASPQMLALLPFSRFLHWVQWGKYLAQESPTMAAAFFCASPETVTFIHSHQLGDWGRLGRRLYRGTWRSGQLACQFFQASSRFFRYLNLDEAGHLVACISSVAERSEEAAEECLIAALEAIPEIEREERRLFLTMAWVMAESHWGDVRAYLQAGSRSLSRVDKRARPKFLSLVERMARASQGIPLALVVEGSRALGQEDVAAHLQVISLAEKLMAKSPQAVVMFLKSSPTIVEKVGISFLDEWFEEGMKLLWENEERGLAYFCLESNRAVEVLERLSSRLELSQVAEVLRMYCKAISGKDIQLLPAQKLKSRGWTEGEKSTTEGTTIFLPSVVEKYPDRQENFTWYKILSTHQAGHLEFGSFDFVFEREGALFPSLRSGLTSTSPREGCATDIEWFFLHFHDGRLVRDIFTAVEDSRIDHRIKWEYPGIRRAYSLAQRRAMEGRQPPPDLPLRAALLEVLVCLSLEGDVPSWGPLAVRERLAQVIQVAQGIQSPQATVEDSAEATLRLYSIISQVPNVEAEREDNQEETDESQGAPGGEGQSLEELAESGKEVSYNSPQEVEYRGDFQPELVQLIQKLRQGALPKGLREVAAASLPSNLKDVLDKDLFSLSDAGDNQPLTDPLPAQPGGGRGDQTPARSRRSSLWDNPLSTEGVTTFLYDEWDFRVSDYRPRWCQVIERPLEGGNTEFFDLTLRNHAGLSAEVKKQFELMSPELFKKAKRLLDGEEVELDAVIQAVVERRAGQSPDDKIYWRRNKIARDVAVAFLLDMSASTAEDIEEDREPLSEPDFGDDPVKYLTWLKTHRSEEMARRRRRKRIIDLEKESTVLLIRALETIGDTYGIYGFSGQGRERVEFFIIKDLEEGFAQRIKERIDKIEPVQATRMGAAIRHATTKLVRQAAKTKILFLISDGRPQDRGYSNDGVDRDYAIHDTKRALFEAKQKGITPFCLTVDRKGHDYLRTMCHDIRYEVVSNIYSLPSRLPTLYRKLTG